VERGLGWGVWPGAKLRNGYTLRFDFRDITFGMRGIVSGVERY
jgi:hypothetical protein